MTTVQSKASTRREELNCVQRIAQLDDDDMRLLLANYFFREDFTSGLSDDKSEKLKQIIKFLKIKGSTLTESITFDDVKLKVDKEKEKKKNEKLSKEDQAAVEKAKKAYTEMCESKSFLASKAVDAKDGFGCLREISKMKMKLETVYGANVGAGGSTSYNLKGYKENKPLGAGSIVLNDDLCLHHDDLGADGISWKNYYHDYSKATKHGVLILAGKPEYFQIWAKSEACLEEVKEIPHDRLYAYIEHKKKDGFKTNQGFIVSVNAKDNQGSATVRDGKGYVIFASGNYYHGELKGGKRNGIGTDMYFNGDVYNGEWKDGKKHGKGVYKFADGDVYNGEWEDNNQHGKGVFTWTDGEVYDGEWEDDKKHGKGEYKYASGNVYNGEWEDGKKHGRGVFKYVSGDVNDGEWEDDKQHGNAIYTYANGKKFKVVWENGKRISSTPIN